ncbi:flagellar assembly protein FliW [Actinotalea sp. M2MS4P-6]|uniref:flagellar assembly protein FliW n=1 Tax=Actinotalea sp. M2MS4P-6 TaxID=2983762 RepID=UPI0021E3F6B1|nr:flagellar assembly protein FliW [Actinotalea sp. M2MS4P-6]MCV2392802.1 flagellar assembly protein FliW [Actinotalea sp. M2MS4P-6]
MTATTTDRRTGMTASRTETDAPTIDFVEAPLGLMGLRHYRLHPLDETGFLFSMRSLEADGLRLFVVSPHPYFPDYLPDLDPESVTDLRLGDVDPVLLVVVHPGDDQHPPTANLLAPIVVNPATGAAIQVVLDTDRWPLRAPFTVAD